MSTDHVIIQLPKLVCPTDKTELINSNNSLICQNGHEWKYIDDIPYMVEGKTNYTDAFGLQWNKHRKTQLDSYSKTNITKNRLKVCLGDNLWDKLHSNSRVDVLETGCGAGRFTEILLQTKGAYVTSTDFSKAVVANQLNFPQNGRHRIVRADILSPPFKSGSFDIVLCLGVVQHTPNPDVTIKMLYDQVKPGGWLVFDHYTYTIGRFFQLAVFIRPILKRMSAEKGTVWTDRITKFFFPLHKSVRKSRILQILLARFSPVISFYQYYPELSNELHYEWAKLDTHDSLTDYYKRLRTRRQIRKILSNLGAQSIFCEPGSTGLIGRCQKPILD